MPPPSTIAQVDGYTLTPAGDHITAAKETSVTATLSTDGHPVTDLQPYLDTAAHLTAFHAGDLAFAHLHPQDSSNRGPTLSFETTLPKPGNWRLFLQFQTAGALHTAAITLPVD